eukprot:TRINITY_DN107962_c0_g1_i1.p1 TRINITY_DN107962_c0_g1~~TRINITY_DN107962_c0_g1_i1.p1  ORF type:complete len:430 (-),score=53.31 TRINITY_DN107962_c0_g1_i1:238-1527(-)
MPLVSRVCVFALILAGQLPTAKPAISVDPQQASAIATQLRPLIVFEERDWTFARSRARRSCSSLELGPFCSHLLNFPDDDLPGSALADGLLSARVQALAAEAFKLDTDSAMMFGAGIAHLINKMLSNETHKISHPSYKQVGQGTKSKCFRIAFRRIPPGLAYLPRSFSAGLPKQLKVSWGGIWEVSSCPSAAVLSVSPSFGHEGPAQKTCVVLNSEEGRLRFSLAVAVRELLIGIPEATSSMWGHEAYICGFLRHRETWCRYLEDVAKDAQASKMHGAGSGMFYTNMGHSLAAVEEISFIRVPPGELVLGSVEVSSALSEDDQKQIEVVLFSRPPPEPNGPNPSLMQSFRPSLQNISVHAAVWDADQIIQWGLQPTDRASFVDSFFLRNESNDSLRSLEKKIRELRARHSRTHGDIKSLGLGRQPPSSR